MTQCEKHSKKEEALAKLNTGAKFDEVAREFSEDKARQGQSVVKQSLHSLYGYIYHIACAFLTLSYKEGR